MLSAISTITDIASKDLVKSVTDNLVVIAPRFSPFSEAGSMRGHKNAYDTYLSHPHDDLISRLGAIGRPG